MSDRYRGRRPSPDPRDRYPTADSYVPNSARGARPRSRSPGNFRRRSRTPPRRYDDRDASYNGGRPPRARSPPPARDNDRARRYGFPGPIEIPPDSERISEYQPSPQRRNFSPSRSYRPRSRSPVRRDERPDPYAVKSWRRRTPSPRSARGDGSGRESGANSRRVSPRPYSRKPADTFEDARGPPPAPYGSARARSPLPRSPPRRRDSPPPPPRARSPMQQDPYEVRVRQDSDRGYPTNGDGYTNGRENENYPPADFRDRAPSGPASRTPAGPSGMSPPAGPSSSTPVSMSAHNRPGSATGYGPPPPRGGYRGRGGGPPPPSREYSRDYSGPPPRRGSYGGGFGRGDPYPPRDPYHDRPPPRQRDPAPFYPPGFRGSNNSTSTTYPRTQRFNQNLADLPTIKDGGERLPPLHDPTKAEKLEEEAARLRKMIDEKEAKKRQGLREWDRLERESSTAALKSELAEDHLRTLNGEADGTTAAF